MMETFGQRSECDAKTHKQIIHASISHLPKLPDVRQASRESILIFLCHQNSDTVLKKGVKMSGEEESKRFTAYKKMH